MTNRVFGFIWCIILMAVALLPLRHNGDPRWIFAAAAVLLACFSTFLPNALSPLNRAWTRFGMVMHTIISEIALFVIYYGVITPGGLLLRVFGRHSVTKDFDQAADSYWKSHDNETTDFTKPY